MNDSAIKKSFLNKEISLIKMSFRNIFRHKVKTALSAIAISLGIAAYIFIDGFLLGMNTETRRNIVNYETGAVKIYSKAYYENKDEYPLYEGFNDYQPLLDKLNENGYNACPRAVFQGNLLSQEQELPFLFIGIDPDSEKNVFKSYKYLEKNTNSKFLTNGKYEVLLGVRGAKNLGVKTGDTVRLFTVINKKDLSGEEKYIYQVMELKVCGIINAPDPMINGYIAYLPLDILQDDMGLMLEGHITEICIRKKNAKDYELPGKLESKSEIKNIIGDILPDNLTLVDWSEDAKDYITVSEGDNVTNRLMVLFFAMITLLGIANTMLMSVIERTKEIGMLRSLGMSDFSVIKIFVIEAGSIGFLGSMIGIFFGLIINFYMIYHGFDVTSIIEQMGYNIGYRINGIFRSSWNFGTIIGCLICGTLFSASTAIIPSLQAVRKSVIDAIRFE